MEEEEIDYEPSFTASTPAATFEYKKGVKNVPPVVSETDSPEPKKRKVGTIKESNERRLRGRQKQIDYGKNTGGYERYLSLVSKYRYLIST